MNYLPVLQVLVFSYNKRVLHKIGNVSKRLYFDTILDWSCLDFLHAFRQDDLKFELNFSFPIKMFWSVMNCDNTIVINFLDFVVAHRGGG